MEALTMSIADAAKVLGYGYDYTAELVRSGRLASIPAGKKRRRVPRVALEKYIREEMGGGNGSTC